MLSSKVAPAMPAARSAAMTAPVTAAWVVAVSPPPARPPKPPPPPPLRSDSSWDPPRSELPISSMATPVAWARRLLSFFVNSFNFSISIRSARICSSLALFVSAAPSPRRWTRGLFATFRHRFANWSVERHSSAWPRVGRIVASTLV